MTRLGRFAWRLATNVDVAVAQIIVVALMATVGIVVRQLPGFAFHSASDYATEMGKVHDAYDPAIGAAAVSILEQIGVFHLFGSWWFSLALTLLLISIVICTVDRTPRLRAASRPLTLVQPDAFFDPALPERAQLTGVPDEAVVAALRRQRYRVRREETADGIYLTGDRNQYTKLATLLTHTGLVLFLVAAAVTSLFGFEEGLVVPDGTTTTVQPIGTPGLLVVRNLGFSAPTLPNGAFADFSTDLAVYRDGEQVARQTVRVNEPLAIDGYTLHQNGFGPAPAITLRDAAGSLLWSGPIALTNAVDGRPFGTMGVPGRAFGLQLLLDRDSKGAAALVVIPYRVAGSNSDGTDRIQESLPLAVGVGETAEAAGLGISVTLDRVAAYTLLIAKRDPGQGIVWGAFLFLIAGLIVTFYLPRRRIWARLSRDGTLSLVGRFDRGVDTAREYGRLIDELVAARTP